MSRRTLERLGHCTQHGSWCTACQQRLASFSVGGVRQRGSPPSLKSFRANPRRSAGGCKTAQRPPTSVCSPVSLAKTTFSVELRHEMSGRSARRHGQMGKLMGFDKRKLNRRTSARKERLVARMRNNSFICAYTLERMYDRWNHGRTIFIRLYVRTRPCPI